MSTYHVNPETGNASPCKATKGKCPFGGAYHAGSLAECEAIFAEDMLGRQTFISTTYSSVGARPGVVQVRRDLSREEKATLLQDVEVRGDQVPPMCFVSDKEVDIEEVEDISDVRSTTVPSQGLWLSRTKGNVSDWTPSLKEYRNSHGTQVVQQSVAPRDDARILKIDSYEDLKKVISVYPGSAIGHYGTSVDSVALKADGYDGIWLTRKGWIDTRPDSHASYSDRWYGPEADATCTELNAARINTSGWIPSMVLFHKGAVGELGAPQITHRDANGRNANLMLLGERAAAAKYSTVTEFAEAQKNDKLVALTAKHRRKRNPTAVQQGAIDELMRVARERGITDETLDSALLEAKKDAHFGSTKEWRRMNKLARERFAELHGDTYEGSVEIKIMELLRGIEAEERAVWAG